VDKPELIIPIRLDPRDALRQLQRFGDEGTQQTKRVKRGTDEVGDSFERLGIEMANFVRAQVGFVTFQNVLAGIAARAKETADYIRGITQDFITLRQSLQQVAALTGQQASDKFTVEQAKQAAAAALTPERWKEFQEQFQSYAGAQLEGPQAKLTPEQSQQYQQKVAEFAQARGIQPGQTAELAGSLLEYANGPQDVNKLMASFGRTFQTLEKSRTPVARLLPQMSRIMAYGTTAEEASQLLSVIAPAMPNQEQTGIENTFKAIRNLKLEGKGGLYGIKEGMSAFEEVKALAENIQGRTKAGEDLSTVLKDAKIGDMREFRGIQGFAKQGVELGGFERFRRYAQDTPEDFVDQALKLYERSASGAHARPVAELALEKAKKGEEMAPVEALREQAEIELTREGRLKQNAPLDWFRFLVGGLTGVNVNQQLIQERAFDIAQAQRGVKPDPLRRGGMHSEYRVIGPGATTNEANEMILAELRKQTELMQPHSPLSAPPPPSGGPGGGPASGIRQ
jgi:hypothetical protein